MKKRLGLLKENKNFIFSKIDICDYDSFQKFVKNKRFDVAINLAAQAGVRYSLINPQKYLRVNILGFLNFIEIFKKKIK